MACTSSRRKDVGGVWQWQHPPHSTREAQRLCAIRRTSSLPLPYSHTGLWSCKEGSAGLAMPQDVSKVSWSRAFSFPHRLARGADELEASWRHGLPRSRPTSWPSLVSSRRTAEPGVPPSETWSTQLVMPAQTAPARGWPLFGVGAKEKSHQPKRGLAENWFERQTGGLCSASALNKLVGSLCGLWIYRSRRHQRVW